MTDTLTKYDEWLKDDSHAAALVMRQYLEPVEGKDAVIFPPTYAQPKGLKDEDWTGYNIDRFDDGTTVCQIDSVGSQANRMEPIFKSGDYVDLVPQIIIQVGERQVNLLDAGHRAADAIVRFSELGEELRKAFEAWQDSGDAEALAKIAPTTIVFGAWDSRATQAKLPRIVRSVVRAYNVNALHRSAQYIPPVDYVADEVLDAPEGQKQQDVLSELGLSHAPAPWSHGGVIVREIRRDATLNLEAIRSLGASDKKRQRNLRRYILGLALVSFTAPQQTFLREGCQLVPDAAHEPEWEAIKHDGSRDRCSITQADAKGYAIAAAENFNIGKSGKYTFDSKRAKEELGKTSKERKAARTKKVKKSKDKE